MRPLYIDVNGTTDANGNASIPVTMPRMTGRWHNAKFTLGTTAPAEWAVLVNGRPYTYGRGRRVTLGPELIQDGQTATVSVIGGPAKATVDGTVTGVSGTPDEIMAVYTPAPNTIALDTAAPQTNMGSLSQIAGGATVRLNNQAVPVGTQSIGFVIENNLPPATIFIGGDQTGFAYVPATFPNVGPYWFAWDVKDTTVSFHMTPTAGNNCTVDFFASPLVQPPNPTQILAGVPALWQAPQLVASISTGGIANGSAVTIVNGAPGQQIYPFWFYLTGTVASAQSMQLLLRDTTNHTAIADLAAPSAVFNILNNGDFKGATSAIPLAAGLELFNNTGGGAAITCMGWLAYSQG